MTTSLPLVLITGASGYVGSHVVQFALAAGYPVRLVARPGKVDQLRNFYPRGDNIDIVAIDDVATGDFTEILKGVGAVIHVASPLSGREDSAGMLKSAVEGTLNVAQQAAKAGVKKIVVTASLAALTSPMTNFFTGDVITANDWNDATVEQVLDGSHDSNVFWIYGAVKTIAEQKLWQFADEHPEIEVATVSPPMIYGPILPGTKIDNEEALLTYSTIGKSFYKNLLPANGSATKLKEMQDAFPLTVDVRDVAKVHILALSAPPTSQIGRKRFLVAGEPFLWKDAVEHLIAVRPELRERLPDPSEAKKVKTSTMDVSRTKEVLGIDAFIDWRQTVEDSIDSLLEIQEGWART